VVTLYDGRSSVGGVFFCCWPSVLFVVDIFLDALSVWAILHHTHTFTYWSSSLQSNSNSSFHSGSLNKNINKQINISKDFCHKNNSKQPYLCCLCTNIVQNNSINKPTWQARVEDINFLLFSQSQNSKSKWKK
jgi:hypothetical protein